MQIGVLSRTCVTDTVSKLILFPFISTARYSTTKYQLELLIYLTSVGITPAPVPKEEEHRHGYHYSSLKQRHLVHQIHLGHTNSGPTPCILRQIHKQPQHLPDSPTPSSSSSLPPYPHHPLPPSSYPAAAPTPRVPYPAPRLPSAESSHPPAPQSAHICPPTASPTPAPAPSSYSSQSCT